MMNSTVCDAFIPANRPILEGYFSAMDGARIHLKKRIDKLGNAGFRGHHVYQHELHKNPPKNGYLLLENPPHLSMIFPAMNFHLVRGFPMTCDTSPALLGAPKSLHVRACLDSRDQRGGGNPVWIVSNWGISWKKQPILATEEGKTENPTILFSWFNQLNLHLVRGLPSCVWRLGGKHL